MLCVPRPSVKTVRLLPAHRLSHDTDAMANKSTRHLILKHIEHSVEIQAAPDRVWALVSDLPRISEWSPQVIKTVVLGGPLQQGSRLINLNRKGLLVWPTRATVVRFEPGREIAWRIKENDATWSFTLEPTGAGTQLVQRREAPEGLSELSISLTDRFLGGQGVFQAELQAGMRQTLGRVKQLAEQ